MSYQRLSSIERETFYKYLHQGKSFRRMASLMGRASSTLSREFHRHKMHYDNIHGYRVFAAQHFSEVNASSRKKGDLKLGRSPRLFDLVVQKLKKRWSPEQISKYLARNYPNDPTMGISHESIYAYLYVRGKGQLKEEVKKLPQELIRSMTYDNGTEMAQHRTLTKETNMVVYFAHPYSPWERGTNENTNMLIRDFFPKNTDLSKLSRYRIKKVQDLLNERPRKTLNWRSPAEAMGELLQNPF